MSYLPGVLALGVAAALSPGPLMALAGKETLRAGFGAGMRVSLIPSAASLPLPLVCTVGYTWAERGAKSPELKSSLIALTALFSALLFVWFAYREFKPQAAGENPQPSWRALAFIGWSNPPMILFWATVGGQLASTAYQQHHWPGALIVIAGFYIPVVVCEAAVLYCLHLSNLARRRIAVSRQTKAYFSSRFWAAVQRWRWSALAYFALAIWILANNWAAFGPFGSTVLRLTLSLSP